MADQERKSVVHLAVRMESASATCHATVRLRTNLGLHHLLAACRCVRRIGEVEKENASKEFGDFWQEILQDSLSTVMLAFASLESYANELYFGKFELPLNANAAEVIFESMDDRRCSPFEKFEMAVALRADTKLDKGRSPYQDVRLLNELRNAAVHFRPEWDDDLKGKHEAISHQLASRLKPSPFFPRERLFPRSWASHGTAVWIITSVVSFLDDFYSRAKLESPLKDFKQQLTDRAGVAF